ncbi:hypothetical protein GCM10025867_49830 (plasmid) [Frondihabitans sucicola]|uniref:Uncharacterized protein n=1 Tax=Frondihabitans sucicola TaxID=1268041 RepID=A0ABM8GW90_9MICO|nr:hypothetical protein GCM10025867_49830 [Frondihabitans sucicola]
MDRVGLRGARPEAEEHEGDRVGGDGEEAPQKVTDISAPKLAKIEKTAKKTKTARSALRT